MSTDQTVLRVAERLCTSAGYAWPCQYDRYGVKWEKEAVSKWWIELAEHALDAADEIPHTHVAGTTIGKHIDTCARCGRDLRHSVHQRSLG